MSDYETYTCEQCGSTFRAHPGARAAETGYCSPACATDAVG